MLEVDDVGLLPTRATVTYANTYDPGFPGHDGAIYFRTPAGYKIWRR